MEPKPEAGGSGIPGNKRVAAKAVKASAAKSLFPSTTENGGVKLVAQAKQSKVTPRSSTDFDITSSSASETPQVAPVKVAAAPKAAAKAEQKSQLNRGNSVKATPKEEVQPSISAPPGVSVRKLASMRFEKPSAPPSEVPVASADKVQSSTDGGSASDSSSGNSKVPAWKLALKAAAAGRAAGTAAVADVMKGVQSPNTTVDSGPPTPASLMQRAHSRDSINSREGANSGSLREGANSASFRESPSVSEDTQTTGRSSAGFESPRSSGAASPFLGREKPSLRKAARMAAMLNRFAPPESTAPSEPKVPAWKLANQQAQRKNSMQGSFKETSPPPAPAPTPAASRTTTPHDLANRSGSNSRPGTDMSGAYSDTDDGGISRGDHTRSDSEYESTGMSDIPSGYDDTDLSESEGDFRPNSAPPTSTLFGVSMKKALSRPADRVEQAEKKAERLEQEVKYGNSIYMSDTDMSVSVSGMSGSEMDTRRPQQSRHLSSLERIIANSDNRAQAKQQKERPESGLSTYEDHNKTDKEHRETAERGRDLISKLLGVKSAQEAMPTPPEVSKKQPSAPPVKPPTPEPGPVVEVDSGVSTPPKPSSMSDRLAAFGGGGGKDKVGKLKSAVFKVQKTNQSKKGEAVKNLPEQGEDAGKTPEEETNSGSEEQAANTLDMVRVPDVYPVRVAPVQSSITPAMSLRVDIDRLSTQRISAGLKADKHGPCDVSVLKGGVEQEVKKRFLSVSAGGLYMATYFTLLEMDGYVDCTSHNLGGTSEKLCDLTRCSIEVEESPLSLCGFILSVKSMRDKKQGVVMKPSRLSDLLEWGSVIQQCVDLLSVNDMSKLDSESKTETKRDFRGRVFKLPGQDEIDDNKTRSNSAARSIWRISAAKELNDRKNMTEAYEAKATKSGVIPTGIDESNMFMDKFDVGANSMRRLNRNFDERHVSADPLRSNSAVFNKQKEVQQDPLLMEVLRMRTSAPRIPLPTREQLSSSQPKNYHAPSGLLDSTRGSRLAMNASNRAVYLNSQSKNEKGGAYSSGMQWLEDYRAMVRELDDMEFSTNRSLGFVQNKVYSQNYSDYRKPVNLYSQTIPACGGIGGISESLLSRRQPDVILSHLDRQDAQSNGIGRSAYGKPILTPGVSVPILHNLNTKEFVGTPINPFVAY